MVIVIIEAIYDDITTKVILINITFITDFRLGETLTSPRTQIIEMM